MQDGFIDVLMIVVSYRRVIGHGLDLKNRLGPEDRFYSTQWIQCLGRGRQGFPEGAELKEFSRASKQGNAVISFSIDTLETGMD